MMGFFVYFLRDCFELTSERFLARLNVYHE